MKKVLVRRATGDHKSDIVDVEKINGVKWDNESGGIHKKTRGYSLYGYLSYEEAKKLNINCSGQHDMYKNGEAKICIPARCNKGEYEEGYKYLMGLAGEKPDIRHRNPEGKGPCTKMILSLLNEKNTCERKELRDQITSMGYEVNTFRNAIKRLLNQGKVVTEGSPYSPCQKIVLNKEIC